MPRLKLKFDGDNFAQSDSKLTQKNNLNLNLNVLPKFDFNQEFMENADDFSPSWREGCRKINLLKE
jgi:hypothetical protein